MKKESNNKYIVIFLLFIFIYIFIYSQDIKKYILFALDIWVNNLIPSLFPFLLLSKLLIYYGFINILSNLFGKYINKIYNVNESSTFAIITSIFTGCPTGSIYILELLNSKKIDENDANCLITFTNFANPLFIISGIGESLLNCKRIGIYIFIIHLISGLITGFILRNRNYIEINNYNNKEIKKNNKSFITILIDSINESIKILINILGIIIFFLIIISIIDTFLPNNYISIIIKGIIEMTSSITIISSYKINLRLKVSLIGAFLSFSGLSIHFQTKSIIDNSKIKYKNYFIGRIIHSIICFLMLYIFFI